MMLGTTPTKASHRRFPPGVGNLLIPLADRRSAQAGIALYSPSRASRILAQRVIWVAVGAFGPSLVPGHEESPFARGQWPELSAAVHEMEARFGKWDATAVYVARDPTVDTWSMLLIRDGEPYMWVRRRPNGRRVASEREAEVLRLIESSGEATFLAPSVVDEFGAGDGAFVVTRPVVTGLHRPANPDDLLALTSSISAALRGLSRPAVAPERWAPCHGDLTPWNLRRSKSREIVIVDWEDASWAPPGADLVAFRATARALGLKAGVPSDWTSVEFEEAREFWIEHWRNRANDARRPSPESRTGDEASRIDFAHQVIRILDC